jgi:hypothetical protein
MPFTNPIAHSLGGKASSANMTPDERKARSRYAVIVRGFGKRSPAARAALKVWKAAAAAAAQQQLEKVA